MWFVIAATPFLLLHHKQDGTTFVILNTLPKIEDIAADAAKASDLAIIQCKLMEGLGVMTYDAKGKASTGFLVPDS